jgi:hypothetical protein
MQQNNTTQPPSLIGTPRDYSSDLYRVYFEVGEFKNSARKILREFLGGDASGSMTELAHGYEVELPIQCVPDILRQLVEANIAVYQIVRYEKINGAWQSR